MNIMTIILAHWIIYCSIRFETEVLHQKNYQGNAVVNYTDIGTQLIPELSSISDLNLSQTNRVNCYQIW